MTARAMIIGLTGALACVSPSAPTSPRPPATTSPLVGVWRASTADSLIVARYLASGEFDWTVAPAGGAGATCRMRGSYQAIPSAGPLEAITFTFVENTCSPEYDGRMMRDGASIAGDRLVVTLSERPSDDTAARLEFVRD